LVKDTPTTRRLIRVRTVELTLDLTVEAAVPHNAFDRFPLQLLT